MSTIAAVHDNENVIERSDGVLIGAVKVDPANMSMATDEEWDHAAQVWGEFVSTLDFPIQIFSPTRVGANAGLIDRYMSRQDDEDISQKPLAKELINDFIDWYPQYLDWQGTHQREYYILVACEPGEQASQGRVSSRESEPISSVSLDEQFRGDHVTDGRGKNDRFSTIRQRCQMVVQEGVAPIPDCSGERVNSEELAALLNGRYPQDEAEDNETSTDRFQPPDVTLGTFDEVKDGEARLGDRWLQTITVDGWGDEITSGFLDPLFRSSTHNTDVSIHISPHGREDEAAETDTTGSTVDVSFYVTHYADTREELAMQQSDISTLMQKPPINADLRIPRKQDAAFASVCPVAEDELENSGVMSGDGAGAMMPFSSATLIEENGVEWGVMPYNGSPVIVDRFDRDDGYNVLAIGNIGSGKSFGTHLDLQRTLLRRSDVEVFVFDMLDDYKGLSWYMQGTDVNLDSGASINPLEIKETPDELFEGKNADIDPYGSKIKDVMSFFETYLTSIDFYTDGWRGVLERSVQMAYKQRGITRDPATHGNKSPTINDVLDILGEMATDPEKFTRANSEKEREQIEDMASHLLVAFEVFQDGGELEHLADASEVDIGESRVTRFDFKGCGSKDDVSVTMQLLLSNVAEHAKTGDKKTILVIDEGRAITRHSSSMKQLARTMRHSRHYDLSVQLNTQTVDEFFAREEAKVIADSCSIKQLYQIVGIDDRAAEYFGLSSQQASAARVLTPGTAEKDYSEALLGVQGKGWRRLHIRASNKEKRFIDGKFPTE